MLEAMRNQLELKSLRLDFSGAINITDNTLISVVILLQKFKQLQNIALAFSYNSNISDFVV